MKLLLFILTVQLLSSCYNNNHPQAAISNDPSTISSNQVFSDKEFAVFPDIVLKDFTTWYNYTYDNIRLSQDFTGLDIDSSVIDKTTFLNKLINGKVVAFETRLLEGLPVYRLYKLNSSDESIQSTIKQLASIEIKNFKMEGKQLPQFEFTDLNGNHYNSISTQGKILVLKCWFINCLACVREFPECNELVSQYANRNDILFISLARDSQMELLEFLKAKQFSYVTVPKMENYMADKLAVNEYPTHILVDKSGKIIKVVNSVEELKPFLDKESIE